MSEIGTYKFNKMAGSKKPTEMLTLSKVKYSLYKPGEALRVAASLDSKISKQPAH
jgi:hypothetical protein